MNLSLCGAAVLSFLTSLHQHERQGGGGGGGLIQSHRARIVQQKAGPSS